MRLLSLNYYEKTTKKVAIDLLGKIFMFKGERTTFKARIVETEAYLGLSDKACHSYGGKRTPRTNNLYVKGGHLYIYLIYGMYHCLNIVTRSEKHPEAVLIRGMEPLSGIENMKVNRNQDRTTNLLSGPGKICQAMNLNKNYNQSPLDGKSFGVFDDGFKVKKSELIKAPRIGIDYAEEAALWPLRFYLKGSKHISKSR